MPCAKMNKQNNNKTKIAFIHGRPGPHPMHGKFAKSINADFYFADFRMRWLDKSSSSLYRLVSWIVCAFTFPNKKKYDIFFVDGLFFFPIIMKMLFLLNKKQKIVVNLGSHTLYFLYAHRFSKFTEWIHIQAMKRCDAFICEGNMANELVKSILKEKHPKLYTVFMGIPNEHYPDEKDASINIKGKNILFMGNVPEENRLWYKGVDVMIDAFRLAFKKDPYITFTIVGEFEKRLTDKLVANLDENTKKAICFTGATDDLGQYTKTSSLYLHTARGEAFGITILIAMASGIPPIISEWTGAKEVVEQVDKRFIVPLDTNSIAEKILWYFNLPITEKEKLSESCKTIATNYTEENFKNVFTQLENDFGF